MSKLSTLKQQAYQAGKKKNWAEAISLYEQILERDKDNPTVINELGDLCLKGDETRRAIRYFLSAAAKYRSTGLLNNAVAIYKKILRHEAENLNAHWYLAETRAKQGLSVEGENHAVHFLDNSEDVSGDIKEIFLKRCKTMFELFPESRVILPRLVQVFNMWSMTLEGARAQCLVLCLDFAGGQEDEARADMDALTAKVPDVVNYPEFTRWNGIVNPDAAGTGGVFADFGSVSLDDGGASEPAAPEVSDEARVEAPAETPAETPAAADAGFGDLSLDAGSEAAPEVDESGEKVVEIPVDDDVLVDSPAAPVAEELDDEGCFAIDDDEAGGSLDDLVAQAAVEVETAAAGPEVEEMAPVQEAETTLSDADDTAAAPAAAADVPAEADGGVDLLAQMLEEDGPDLIADATGQMETITSEIGSVVGGDGDDDAERLYEMGMVYLEMGMFDQACESFETAAADDAFSVRAHEMWGITLQRANRADEAIAVLNHGLDFAATGSREHHGLMYHLGMAHEATGDTDKAIDCFRTINDVDPTYLDVGRRLAKLTAV